MLAYLSTGAGALHDSAAARSQRSIDDVKFDVNDPACIMCIFNIEFHSCDNLQTPFFLPSYADFTFQ